MNFLKSNFWEIERSPLLHQLGALLSFLHLLNYFFWKPTSHFLHSPNARPLLCWDFFSNCTRVSHLTHSGISSLFTAYLIFSTLALLFFLWRRFVKVSWICLFFATAIFLFFYIFDASLSQDAYGLLLFLSLGYLLAPSKAAVARWTTIAFYLVLGYRQLSPEWLTGSGLHGSLPFPYKVLEWVAAAGVITKFTLPFLLVSPFGQRLTLAVIGLSVYQSLLFNFTHDFGSLVLIFLNLFYVLDYFSRKKAERESLYQSYAHPEPSKLWPPILVGFYLLMQSPFLPATWPVEIFYVKGPQSTMECAHINFVNYENHLEQLDNLLPQNLSSDLKCKPLVAFNSAKEACLKHKDQPQFLSLSTYFLRRDLLQTTYQLVFSIEDICLDQVTYKNSVVNK